MQLRKLVLNVCYFSGIQALLAPVLRGNGSILMLHHIRNNTETTFSPNEHLTISPEFLDRLLGELAKDFDFVSMDQVVERMDNARSNKSGRPFIAITLDCLLYTSPSPRDKRQSRMPSSA